MEVAVDPVGQMLAQGGAREGIGAGAEHRDKERCRRYIAGSVVVNRDGGAGPPGSLLNVTLDTKSPLAYGMPEKLTLWSEESPVWDAPAEYVVARYPAKDVLASGWLLGEKYLTGKAALLDVPVGTGHIVMFGMRPQYRDQSYQNFKLFFNAMAYR